MYWYSSWNCIAFSKKYVLYLFSFLKNVQLDALIGGWA